MVTGLMVRWPGTSTAVWHPCSRDAVDMKFLELLQQFGSWFTDHEKNPPAVVEFGEDHAGTFKKLATLDMSKYIPARTPVYQAAGEVPPTAPPPTPEPTPTPLSVPE
jgi:hypothetical protein